MADIWLAPVAHIIYRRKCSYQLFTMKRKELIGVCNLYGAGNKHLITLYCSVCPKPNTLNSLCLEYGNVLSTVLFMSKTYGLAIFVFMQW